jgi:hypothetical protein
VFLYEARAILFEVTMARSTMATIREDLRGMTEAGTADWTAGTTAYFTDEVLDAILDRYAEPFVYKPMEPEDPYLQAGGTYHWTVYEIEDTRNIEQSSGGTATFWIQDNIGGTVLAADYSVDYRNGIVTFAANTLGKPYFCTGYSYDLNGAAAEIWQKKANHASSAIDFSTDNHSIKRSNLYKQYMDMANYYRSLSEDAGGGRGVMVREDTDDAD